MAAPAPAAAPTPAPTPAPVGVSGGRPPTIGVHHRHAGRLGCEAAATRGVQSRCRGAKQPATEVRLGPVLPVRRPSQSIQGAHRYDNAFVLDLGYLRDQNHMHGELTRIPERATWTVRAALKRRWRACASGPSIGRSCQSCSNAWSRVPHCEHYKVAMWLKAEPWQLTMKGGYVDRRPWHFRRIVASHDP